MLDNTGNKKSKLLTQTIEWRRMLKNLRNQEEEEDISKEKPQKSAVQDAESFAFSAFRASGKQLGHAVSMHKKETGIESDETSETRSATEILKKQLNRDKACDNHKKRSENFEKNYSQRISGNRILSTVRVKRHLRRKNTFKRNESGNKGLLYGAAFLLVVILCAVSVVSAIASTPYGILFLGNDQTGSTLRETMKELNIAWLIRINEAKQAGIYDDTKVTGNRADWREVLAVYAVIISEKTDNGNLFSFDENEKDILTGVFWYMNRFTCEITETTKLQWVRGENAEGKPVKKQIEIVTRTLEMNIFGRSIDETAQAYDFTEKEIEYVYELISDKNRNAWNKLLYGIHGGNGDVVSVALSQLGNVGGEPYWMWYGYSCHVEWCCIFVSWCAEQCGLIENGVIPRFENCGYGAYWFQKERRWQDNSYEPSLGDIIFFSWDGTGNEDHVGIVEKVEEGYVYTIEGNWGDACVENRYPLGWYEILGYGMTS